MMTRFRIRNGYKEYYQNGKWHSTHRRAFEKRNGTIPKGHVVHHKNGNKLDNRSSNLTSMTRSAHTALHNRRRRKKR